MGDERRRNAAFFVEIFGQSGKGEMLPCPFFFCVFMNLKDHRIAYNYKNYIFE